MNNLIRKASRLLPDSLYLQLMFYKHFHKFANLKNPRGYNEKLQWMKMNDRNPLYTKIVDKLAMKEYIAEKVGAEYAVPTLGVWDKPEDIDFSKLPNQFVLKWNHDSGSIVICKDKSKFTPQDAIQKLSYGAKVNGYWYGREWPYKNVPPKLIAEPYLEDKKTGELRDYKFFGFDGDVKMFLIASQRQNPNEDTKFDFYDMNCNHIVMVNQHPNAKVAPEPPVNFTLMKELSEKLSKGFAHLRVDFYEVDGVVYIGELTLFHGSGLMTFEPEKWYNEMGDWIDLSKCNKQ